MLEFSLPVVKRRPIHFSPLHQEFFARQKCAKEEVKGAVTDQLFSIYQTPWVEVHDNYDLHGLMLPQSHQKQPNRPVPRPAQPEITETRWSAPLLNSST